MSNSGPRIPADLDLSDSPLADIKMGEQTKIWAENRQLSVAYLESTDSTNAWAKKEAFHKTTADTPFKIYLTDLQTAGRGRGAHTWQSPHLGHQLMTTWSILNPEIPHPTLSPKLGLAVWRAAVSTWNFLPWSLKAPNDLYLGNKKVAGLLLENVIQGEQVRTLFGLGMNIISHPTEVETSTSLCENLPLGSPLLAEDWFQFLDRLSLEFSLAIETSPDTLNSTECQSLMLALNLFPGLKTKYSAVSTLGQLTQGKKIISWMDL